MSAKPIAAVQLSNASAPVKSMAGSLYPGQQSSKHQISKFTKNSGVQQSEQKEVIEPSQEIVVPSTTIGMWFSPDSYENKVTDLEKESLPEFFNERYPSKTPTVYKEYRNFMIALYRMNPTIYLSGTTCRRHLSGDVNGILRVHAFLEKWGLINFQA